NLAKIEPYLVIKEKFKLTDEEIVYVGDDLVDIPLLRRVGVGIAVANALPEVKQYAAYVTKAAGGHGAIREAIELILKAQDKFNLAVERVTKATYKD
ncbi:MAG: HAD hydrolase family protein, partial [Candidatus Marinimicrobia bacterium]|nr:HAD hydrolase family protein [Candidatus Neomarinimicrobiota bacterium]